MILFSKRVLKWVSVLLVAGSAGHAEPGQITRKRVAVFHEEGFPSRSPRSVEWYRDVLEQAGFHVRMLGVKELAEPKSLSQERCDILILASGGLVPRDAEEALGRFMRGGGTVVVDGSIAHPHVTAPPEVMAEAARLRNRYRKGEVAEAYLDYLFEQGAVPGVVFRYDTGLKRWAPEMSVCLRRQWTPLVCEEFEFEPWPNPWQVNPDYYGRPFNADLKLSPALAKAGWGQALPATLPLTIETDGGETITATPQENRMFRWTLFGQSMGDRRPAVEYANDVLVPVYCFEKPSGIRYPAFSLAGKQAKDCESDFFVYRCHRAPKEGYTLVHFGLAGAHLLRSAGGVRALLAALELAEARLPGERSPEFIANCHRLEASLERTYGAAIEAMANQVRLARVYHAKGQLSAAQSALHTASETRALLGEISFEGERFRMLKLDREEQGNAERKALADRCDEIGKRMAREAAATRKALRRITKPPRPVEVSNPWQHVFLGFDFAAPGGLTRQLELAARARELGFSGMPIYWTFASPRVFRETGHTTGVRFDGMQYGDHFAQQRFESVQLDPKTGAVRRSGQTGWWETPESRAVYDRELGWRLRKITESAPEVRRVFCMQERSLGWSLWGERMRGRFLAYLKREHGTAKQLNAAWGSHHATFQGIALPLKRPETPLEHARWEGWTRFREVYVMEEERRPLIRAIKASAPGLEIMAYQSYCHQTGYPAHGINYYEYGKALDWNTLEMGSLGILRDEVMTADIAGFYHKNITPEWGATYACCMPGGQLQKIDWLRHNLWNGLGWGQIGWCTFAGSQAGLHYSNFIDVENRVTPAGFEIREIRRDLKAVEPVILDGEREEPPVRIVFSPTTQRHTNWPGIESEKSFQAVSGFYRAFQMLHVQARAIDEGAILDGRLSPACRLLVLPDLTYLNRALYARVKQFIEDGGTVLASADSGRFDQYGSRRDFLATLAGVASRPLEKAEVDLGNGQRYVSRPMSTSRPEALSVVFPEGTEVALHFEDGPAAVTRTRLGKGWLFLCGIPFGRQFLTEYPQRPEAGLKLLERLLAILSVEREYRCRDVELVVRPWIWRNRKFLVITNPTRTRLVPAPGKSGFPFTRAPLATPFDLKVRGLLKVTDYGLGLDVPCSHADGYTTIHGLAPNPGGVVYALRPADAAVVRAEPAESTRVVAGAVPSAEGPGADQALELPFRGRLGQEAGIVRIGDYRFGLEVESRGQVWGGDLYLLVECGAERLRKLCVQKGTLTFAFLKKVLKVECQQVSPVMPVGLICRIHEEEKGPRDPRCHLLREKYLGEESLVLRNGYVQARLLPGVGGRLIEFASRDDGANQLFVNPKAVQGAAGDGGWIDVGGIEEHLGQWPGPIWNAAFSPEVVSDTPGEVAVRMRSPAIRLGTDQAVIIEKEFRLAAGEARLRIHQWVKNVGAVPRKCRLMVHPELLPGGDVTSSDTCYFDGPDGPTIFPFQLGKQATYQNRGGWSAVVDADKQTGLLELYPREAVELTYVLIQQQCCNLEFGTPFRELKPGEALDLAYALGLVRGITAVHGASAELAASLTLSGNAVYRQQEPVQITVRGAALAPGVHQLAVSIERSEGGSWKTVAQVGTAEWRLTPETPARSEFRWKTGDLPDGSYAVVATVSDTKGLRQLTARRPFEIAGKRLAEWEALTARHRARLEALKRDASGTDREAERGRRVRAANLLYELEDAVNRHAAEEVKRLSSELDAALSPR